MMILISTRLGMGRGDHQLGRQPGEFLAGAFFFSRRTVCKAVGESRAKANVNGINRAGLDKRLQLNTAQNPQGVFLGDSGLAAIR